MKYQQYVYECVGKKWMIIGCNIWIICLELNCLFYDPCRILQLSEFVWTLRSSVWVVFNNFLLIDLTDRSKNRSNLNLNDLLEIKLTFLRSESYFAINFLKLYGR